MNKTIDEIWKPIDGYEGLYEVSTRGRIKSFYGWNGHEYINREYITNGYLQTMPGNYRRMRVSLVDRNRNKKCVFVHRLVAKTFLTKPKGCNVVNHKDFDPTNNNVENLEWVTDLENHEYSTRAGRRGYLSISERQQIAEEYKNGAKSCELKSKYGVSAGVIRRALEQYNVPIDIHRGRKYNINLKILLQEIKAGKTNKELAEKYGCTRDLIAQRRYRFKKGGMVS